jgi:hypothetical protein
MHTAVCGALPQILTFTGIFYLYIYLFLLIYVLFSVTARTHTLDLRNFQVT